jgi:hypothetical protein
MHLSLCIANSATATATFTASVYTAAAAGVLQ